MINILLKGQTQALLHYLLEQPLDKEAIVKFIGYATQTQLFNEAARVGQPSKPNYQLKKNLVERLACKLMKFKANTGKKQKCYSIVKQTFDLLRANNNPLIVFYHAFVNGYYRQNVRYLKYGSGNLAKAVDMTIHRSLSDFLTNWINIGLKSNKSIAKALAEQLLACSKGSSQSKLMAIKHEKDKVSAKANIS
jgi:small subunit ribosomal protein S7